MSMPWLESDDVLFGSKMKTYTNYKQILRTKRVGEEVKHLSCKYPFLSQDQINKKARANVNKYKTNQIKKQKVYKPDDDEDFKNFRHIKSKVKVEKNDPYSLDWDSDISPPSSPKYKCKFMDLQESKYEPKRKPKKFAKSRFTPLIIDTQVIDRKKSSPKQKMEKEIEVITLSSDSEDEDPPRRNEPLFDLRKVKREIETSSDESSISSNENDSFLLCRNESQWGMPKTNSKQTKDAHHMKKMFSDGGFLCDLFD